MNPSNRTLAAAAASFTLSAAAFAAPSDLLSTLRPRIQMAIADFDQIPEERRQELDQLAEFMMTKGAGEDRCYLTFICTHNSRRSHLAQVWAQTAAVYYDVSGIETFSGGTEVTACNPRTVRALRRAGFSVVNPTPQARNPRYLAQFAELVPPLELWSKRYDDGANPERDYVAVLTCSHADQTCPSVEGCAWRIAIPYLDPKVADETPAEEATYDERCQQIACEMLYLMSQVKR